MFFDKILDALNLENISNKKQQQNRELILYANKLIDDCEKLSDIINTTTDETEFFGSFEKLISTLSKLQSYEDSIPFANSPSDDLRYILANRQKTVEKFYQRSSPKSKSSNTDQLLINIKNYWQNMSCSNIDLRYRPSTISEKKDFALVDIISYFSKGARTPDTISPLLLSELGITNWNNYFYNLLKDEYLQRASIIEILLADYTMNDLKIIADSVGTKKTGKKFDLAERISHLLPPDQIIQIQTEANLYSVSEKGKQLLAMNNDYVLFHKYRHMISLAEFNDNRIPDGINKRNFYDTMFQALTNRIYFFELNHNFNLLCVAHINIYNLLLQEVKKTNHKIHYDVILSHYIEFLYLSTCFCQLICLATKNKIFSNSLGEYVLPQPDAYIYKLADYESTINYELIFCNKPPSLLTNQEFKSYVHELLNEPMFDNGKWNSLLQKRVRDFYKLLK